MRLLKKIGSIKFDCRCFTKRFFSENDQSKSILKYVFISESEDIFENLALEDWLYENHDLSKREILLLWKNTPAVVIGRHQNPWIEANVEESVSRNVPIVRRNSGGGTVYHDLENLNLSFLSSRELYNRVHNLGIIVRSLEKEWGIVSKINRRSDITVATEKISGTASKLSRRSAYHHCTLLVDVNKHLLGTSLCSPIKGHVIESSATSSKPAPTVNLRELNSSVTINRLMTVVGLEYLSTSTSNELPVQSQGFHFVKPCDEYFLGIDEKIRTFKSWEWIYGRTPKFTLAHKFCIQAEQSYTITFQMKIEAALVKSISIKYPPELNLPNNITENFNASFAGKKYSGTLRNQLEKMYYDKYHRETSRFKIEC